MISINTEATEAERKVFDDALAALEKSISDLDGVLERLVAADRREKELIGELGKLNQDRKLALVESGGQVNKAVIALRDRRKECELELEDLVDVQATLKDIAEEKKPGLYHLAAAACNARADLGQAAARQALSRKAELTRELGSIIALELAVKKLGTPFDTEIHWRFGDGSPFEVLDTKVEHIAGFVKEAAKDARGVSKLLEDIGVKDVPFGPLDKASVGSPLAAYRKK